MSHLRNLCSNLSDFAGWIEARQRMLCWLLVRVFFTGGVMASGLAGCSISSPEPHPDPQTDALKWLLIALLWGAAGLVFKRSSGSEGKAQGPVEEAAAEQPAAASRPDEDEGQSLPDCFRLDHLAAQLERVQNAPWGLRGLRRNAALYRTDLLAQVVEGHARLYQASGNAVQARCELEEARGRQAIKHRELDAELAEAETRRLRARREGLQALLAIRRMEQKLSGDFAAVAEDDREDYGL